MKKLIVLLATMALIVSMFKSFVYARGDKLMDETGEFRFISFNVPCLHNNEDNMPFAEMNPWRLPDEFEINDALESVRQMGGQVARIYTLSVRRPGEDPNIPRHVIGPAQFNDEAYKSLDMTLAIANRKGIRIISPFIDNARWWGGIEACIALGINLDKTERAARSAASFPADEIFGLGNQEIIWRFCNLPRLLFFR